MGFRFTARCDACGHQIDVRDLDAMKGWMRGHYAHGCTLTAREQAIRDCIAAAQAVVAEETTHGNDWRDVPGSRVKHQTLVALRALLDKP